MATPNPKGFEDLLDAKDSLVIRIYDSGGPHFMASLHGKLIKVGATVVRARGRARNIGGALSALWKQIRATRLIEETPEFEGEEEKEKDD